MTAPLTAPMILEPVLRLSQPGGTDVYLGALKLDQIQRLTFVPVVEAKTSSSILGLGLHEVPGGYQRSGDPRRMDRLRAFYSENPGATVPSVVLSPRGGWTFHEGVAPNIGRLVVSRPAAIVDGQHRLGALVRLLVDDKAGEAAKSRLVPFLAIGHLSVDQEQREFVAINDNQVGVKKSLIEWLKKDQTFSGQAAHALAYDPESVFVGRIGLQAKTGSDLVLFKAVKECVEELFPASFEQATGFRADKDDMTREVALEVTIRFWRSVKECLSPFWDDIKYLPPVGEPTTKDHPGALQFRYRLLEETGLRAFSRLGSRLLRMNWIGSEAGPAWELIEAILRRFAESDRIRLVLTKPKRDPKVLELDYNLGSSGKAGVAAMYAHLEAELLSMTPRLKDSGTG